MTSRIVFKTKEIFIHDLESYLAGPCTTSKIIMGDHADVRLAFLKKLEAVSKSLGSKKEAVWRELAAPMVRNFEEWQSHLFKQRLSLTKMITGKLDQDPGFATPYQCLGMNPLILFNKISRY